EAAERRAAVPGDQGRGVEPAPPVGPVLVEGQPDEGLDAGEEDAPGLQAVLGVQREVRRHAVGSVRQAAGGNPASTSARFTWASGSRAGSNSTRTSRVGIVTSVARTPASRVRAVVIAATQPSHLIAGTL